MPRAKKATEKPLLDLGSFDVRSLSLEETRHANKRRAGGYLGGWSVCATTAMERVTTAEDLLSVLQEDVLGAAEAATFLLERHRETAPEIDAAYLLAESAHFIAAAVINAMRTGELVAFHRNDPKAAEALSRAAREYALGDQEPQPDVIARLLDEAAAIRSAAKAKA